MNTERPYYVNNTNTFLLSLQNSQSARALQPLVEVCVSSLLGVTILKWFVVTKTYGIISNLWFWLTTFTTYQVLKLGHTTGKWLIIIRHLIWIANILYWLTWLIQMYFIDQLNWFNLYLWDIFSDLRYGLNHLNKLS